MAHPGRNETDSGLRGCRSRLALILINEVPECFVREPFSVFRLFAKAARWRLPPFSNRPADQSTTPSPSPRRIRRLPGIPRQASTPGHRNDSANGRKASPWPALTKIRPQAHQDVASPPRRDGTRRASGAKSAGGVGKHLRDRPVRGERKPARRPRGGAGLAADHGRRGV